MFPQKQTERPPVRLLFRKCKGFYRELLNIGINNFNIATYAICSFEKMQSEGRLLPRQGTGMNVTEC